MSETSWELPGVDAKIRQRAIEKAQRLGIPLADYLTEVVLRAALPCAQPAPPSRPEWAALSLERVIGPAQRVEEASAVDAPGLLNQTLQDAGLGLAALPKRAGFAEEAADRPDQSRQAMGEDASRRQLAAAHEALKCAVADDFSAFARDSAARLSTGLDEVRSVADTAADRTDAAIGRMVEDLRAAREAVEARLHESASETRMRIQAAFAEMAHRTNALAASITDCERLVVRNVEQMRADIAELEDGARTALEETAEGLRQADAALAAEVARTSEANRRALGSVHHDLAAEIAGLREHQDASLTRITQVDAAAIGLMREVTSLRQTVYARASHGEEAVRATLARAQSDWDGRYSALAARLADAEQGRAVDSATDQRLLRLEAAAESEETAHALAALRGQIAAVAAQLDAKRIGEAEHLDDLRTRVIGSEVRAGEAVDEIHGALRMMARLTAQKGQTEERLHKLELALMEVRPEILPGQDEARIQAIRDVEQRIGEFEQRQEAAIQRLQGDIARFVGEQAQRLDALERTRSEPQGFDVAAEFVTLRRSIEERILEVERRSVRGLEQAADTMAELEKKVRAEPAEIRQSA